MNKITIKKLQIYTENKRPTEWAALSQKFASQQYKPN